MLFTVNEPGVDLSDNSAFSQLDGLTLFDDANVADGGVDDAFTRRLTLIDPGTGKFEQSSPWTRNKRTSIKGFSTSSKQEVWDTRKLLFSLRGRQKQFWLPTFYNDITVVVDIQNGTAVVTIQNVGFTRFIISDVGVRQPRNRLRFTLTDGTVLVRDILTASEIDSNTEQITFATNWTQNITVSQIASIDYIEKTRFNTDTINITHLSTLGNAEIRVPTQSVFD